MSSSTTGPPSFAIPGQLLGSRAQYVPGPGTHLHEGRLWASLLGSVVVTYPAPSAAAEQPKQQQQTASKRPTKLAATLAQHRAAPAGGGGAQKDQQQQQLPTISVSRAGGRPHSRGAAGWPAGGGRKQRQVLPEVGDTVLCKVSRLQPKQAVVSILVVCSAGGGAAGVGGGGDAAVDGTVMENDGWQGVIRVQDIRATEKDRVKVVESFRPGDIVRAQVISLGDQANYYLSTAKNELGVIMATSEADNAMYPVSWKEFRDPETGLGESRKVARPF